MTSKRTIIQHNSKQSLFSKQVTSCGSNSFSEKTGARNSTVSDNKTQSVTYSSRLRTSAEICYYLYTSLSEPITYEGRKIILTGFISKERRTRWSLLPTIPNKTRVIYFLAMRLQCSYAASSIFPLMIQLISSQVASDWIVDNLYKAS